MKKQGLFCKKAAYVLLSCLFFVLLFGCKEHTECKNIYISSFQDEAYGNVLSKALPNYDIIYQNRPSIQSFLEKGKGIVTFDVLAQSLMQSGGEYYWYPQTTATVIIAVDRSITREKIKGWNDLMKFQGTIGMSDNFSEAGFFIAAMNYGLKKKSFSSKFAVNHLAQRYKYKQLEFNQFNVPIMILFDYQAVSMNKKGRNLEIIVPEEGTLSFHQGILSKELLTFSDDFSKMMEEEWLCCEGSARIEGYYPSEQAYSTAVFPKDLEKVHRELINSREYINRDIYGTHRYATATAWEYTFSALVAMAFFSLWSGCVVSRSTEKRITVALMGIGSCLTYWMMARYMKWQFATDTLANRYLWYSYYIFIFALPCFFVLLVISVNLSGDDKLPKWWKVLILWESLMFLMVFTNDIHQWVFRFDKAADFWKKNYSYAWGYGLVYLSFIFPMIGGAILLSIKCWKSPDRIRVVFPLAAATGVVLFGLLYVNRVPIAFNADLTFTTCLILWLFSESAMRTNLVPVNTKYESMFLHSPLSMKILDLEGKVIYRSKNSEPLSEEFKKEIIQHREPFILKKGEHILLYTEPLVGGNVVWREDMSEVDELRVHLSNAMEEIKKTNQVLELQREFREQRESVRAKSLLLFYLKEEIGDRLKEVNGMAKQLKNLDAKENSEKYNKILSRINLTATYVKRWCNLLFYVNNESISSDLLVTYISELLEFARWSNIQSASSLNIEGDIPLEKCILLYDLCFDVLMFLEEVNCTELMLNLYQQKEIHMLFISETNFSAYIPSKKLQKQVSKYNIDLKQKYLGEVQSLEVLIPLSGEEE